MDELKEYLQNPKKDYKTGVELLKANGATAQEIKFFESGESKMSVNMVIKKLNNIFRIQSQSKGVKSEPIPAIQIGTKPIIVKRMHFSEVESDLQQTKLLTNKLLSRNWDELDKKEQKYFKNDQNTFEYKKSLLIENSKHESELKSGHAELLHADKDKRKSIADKLVSIKKKQSENWSKIDNIDFVAEKSQRTAETAHVDKADLILRRNNLRARISKLQNQVRNMDDPKHAKKLKDLELAKADLEEIEKSL